MTDQKLSNVQASEKIRNVLAAIDLNLPFYSFISYGLKIVEKPGLGTLATDLEHLFWDVEAVSKWTFNELAAVLIHEIVHCIFLHPGEMDRIRKGNRNSKLWEWAQEYVTNGETVAITESPMAGNTTCPYKLPGNAMGLDQLKKALSGKKSCDHTSSYFYDPNFTGKSTEEVYEILESELKDYPKKSTEGGILAGDAEGNKPENLPTCSACGHKSNGNLGMMDPILIQSKEDKVQEMIERILAAAVFEGGKNQGSIPSGIERQIKKIKKSQVPWKRVLNRIVGQAVECDDYRWEKPDHRHPLSKKYIVPGLYSEKISDVVLAIDTSGSISDEQENQFVSEIAKLHRLVDEITIYTSDCKVHETVKTRSIRDLLRKVKCRGGGGTSFIPVFEAVKKSRCKPSILIYLTDGMGDYPESKPPYPVLWVLTKDHTVPPWGKTCQINI